MKDGMAIDGRPAVPTFTMLAYDGGLWTPTGPTSIPAVLDLRGIGGLAKQRPAFIDHSTEQVAGHTTGMRVQGNSVEASGLMSGHGPHVDQLLASAKNGFPWSGEMGVKVARAHLVEKGQRAVVNGHTFDGPVRVATAWNPNYVSFCTFADGSGGSADVHACVRWDEDDPPPVAAGRREDRTPAAEPAMCFAEASRVCGVVDFMRLFGEVLDGKYATVSATLEVRRRDLAAFAVEAMKLGHRVRRSAEQIELAARGR